MTLLAQHRGLGEQRHVGPLKPIDDGAGKRRGQIRADENSDYENSDRFYHCGPPDQISRTIAFVWLSARGYGCAIRRGASGWRDRDSRNRRRRHRIASGGAKRGAVVETCLRRGERIFGVTATAFQDRTRIHREGAAGQVALDQRTLLEL